MNRLKRFTLLLSLLSSVLVSCVTRGAENPIFSNLLNSTCSAPCWFGVTPGQTSKDELTKLIPTFPYYQDNRTTWTDNQYQSSHTAPDTTNSTFIMIVGDNWATVYINVVDNVVSNILVSSALNNSFEYKDIDFTLDDILRLYGKPTDLFLDSGCFKRACQNLFLVYSKQSILVVVESKDLSLNLQVSPTLPVRHVAFFKPFQFTEVISMLTGNEDLKQCNLFPFRVAWQGYTTVQFPKRLSECY
jgi:hypothetical protein